MSHPHQRGSFFAVLAVEPPTATHHRKKIGRRAGGGQQLYDDPRLTAAREQLAIALAASGRRPAKPLQPPIALAFEFTFGGGSAAYHTAKPDHDNLVKTLQDVLAADGWIENDQGVAICCTAKFLRPGAGSIGIMGRELDPKPATITIVLDGEAVWDLTPEAS